MVISSKANRVAWAWCDVCVASVPIISPETAAAKSQKTLRTIYRWIESGRVHFKEQQDGTIWICPNSLDEERERANNERDDEFIERL